MYAQAEHLPILSFASADELHAWLVRHHATSQGIWVRVAKRDSGLASVSFAELLDAGLCFGWSESTRRKGDDHTYLQRFTPRRTKGTTSRRNREHIQRLIQEGKMTPAGLAVLEL